MCSIFGFIKKTTATAVEIKEIANELAHVSHASRERGKDAWGCGWLQDRVIEVRKSLVEESLPDLTNVSALVGNCRAEPTTEWIKNKSAEHAHPFVSEGYAVVHNGVVANDKELGFSTTTGIDSEVIPQALARYGFPEAFYKLKGSFAVLILDQARNVLHGYRDYKPLVMKRFSGGIVFSSKRNYFSDPESNVVVVPPYTYFTIQPDTLAVDFQQIPRPVADRDVAFVVCSGGLDSTTVAKIACQTHGAENVELLYFTYGCQAEARELRAVREISEFLHCGLRIVDLSFIKSLGGNALVDSSIEIKDSVTGAEYAHEWVPFRNGVMISLTAALCDRYDVRHIYLGLNLEEGGAFPDNTEEFYERFNEVLQLGSVSRPVIHNPLGTLMKHEIVKLAMDIQAPIHLSWSCYRGTELHCGYCAPCFMRRTAFKMNNLPEVIQYMDEI